MRNHERFHNVTIAKHDFCLACDESRGRRDIGVLFPAASASSTILDNLTFLGSVIHRLMIFGIQLQIALPTSNHCSLYVPGPSVMLQ